MLKPPFPSIQSTCSPIFPPSFQSIFSQWWIHSWWIQFSQFILYVFHIFPSSFHSFTNNPKWFSPFRPCFFVKKSPKTQLSSGPSSRRWERWPQSTDAGRVLMAYNGCFDDRGTRALRKSWWLSWEKMLVSWDEYHEQNGDLMVSYPLVN